MRISRLLAAAAGIFLCAGTHALPAEDIVPVKDINTTPRALRIYARCPTDTSQLLVADDGIRGVELWAGDGLQGTTRLIKDIRPGVDSGTSANCIALGSKLLFVADDGTTGNELWISDGSLAGTTLLKDIFTGASGSRPTQFIRLGTNVLFSADDGVSGEELWITDGTASGTALFKDVRSGSSGSNPGNLIRMSDTLAFFSAETAAEGRELWKTDGSSSGTVLVKDIVSGASGSDPGDLTALDTNRLFFSASLPGSGREPYLSEGTFGSTLPLADLYPGSQSGFVTIYKDLPVINGKVIFSGRDTSHGCEPFVSDGTPGGTTLLKDIRSGSGSSNSNDFYRIGSRVIFSAYTPTEGKELYATDGTTAGTSLLADINPGSGDGTDLYGAEMLLDGSALLLRGSVVSGGSQRVYSSDGTSATLLTDLFPGATGARIAHFSPATTAGISFGVPEVADSFPASGVMLTDGSVSGTMIHPGTLAGFTESSAPMPMALVNGRLLFAASDGAHGLELWGTDGTEAGTTRITDINSGPAFSILPPAGFAVLDNKLIFVASDGTNGAELWISDGTNAGTFLLKDIEPGLGSAFSGTPNGSVRRFYVVGAKVVFAATTSAYGRELWMTDGTTAGTTLIQDIRAGSASGVDENFPAAVSTSAAGPALFFVANDGMHGDEVWATTTSVTEITADLELGATGSDPGDLTAIPVSGGYYGIVFRACPSATGCEVFLTTEGAPSLIDVVPGATGSNPGLFTFPSSSRMFFSATTAAAGTELMKSDSPFTTASVVKDVVAGPGNFALRSLTAFDPSSILFVGCDDSSSNCEPWRSDGTSTGTAQIKDIMPGSGSSIDGYGGFGIFNGVAYFQAAENDSTTSGRYFRTDGTPAGTYPLTAQGFSRFAVDRIPNAFINGLGTLFFPAYSPSYGIELFKIGNDLCPSDASKSFPGLCGCGVADSDGDGDGATDCVESCPSDPLKTMPGSCGCGAPDLDTNVNGVTDCLDTQVANVRPPKPSIRYKKNRATVRLTARAGVTYEVSYRVARRGANVKKLGFKRKLLAASSWSLNAPKKRYILYVKYRYLVPGTTVASRESRIASRLRI